MSRKEGDLGGEFRSGRIETSIVSPTFLQQFILTGSYAIQNSVRAKFSHRRY